MKVDQVTKELTLLQTKYEEEKAAWEKEKEELVVEKKMPWFVKGEVSRSKDEIEDK